MPFRSLSLPCFSSTVNGRAKGQIDGMNVNRSSVGLPESCQAEDRDLDEIINESRVSPTVKGRAKGQIDGMNVNRLSVGLPESCQAEDRDLDEIINKSRIGPTLQGRV